MKINAQSFIWLLFAGLIGFSSCSSDEETPVPTIAINTNSLGSDQTAGSAATGATVTINLTAEATEGIAKLNATKTVGGTENSLIGYPVTSNFNSSTKHTWNATYTVTETSGTVVLKFSVEDKKGKISSKSFTITVVNDDYNSYTSVLLFAPLQDNTSKTFLSLASGTTYNFTEASASPASVDMGYFYGNSALAAFASPSDYLTSAYDLSAWATRNATSFRSTSADFAAASSAAGLASTYAAGTPATDGTNPSGGDTRIYNLTDGQVVAFSTAGGKKGLIKVVSRTGTAPNVNLTVAVKVQK